MFERIDARLNEKIVIDQNMNSASREQYRRLAAVLHDAQSTTGLQVVMVASAIAGEGKTLTASNLALTFSESYQKRVLLIDGDLRRPTLHSVFRLDTASGLADGLLATSDTKMLVRQVSTRLAVLPAGRPSSDPMAGLTSERMKRLLDEARQSFDWVILDTPPVMLLPDAHLMSSMVDGAVLVVRAASTPHELVRRAIDAIGPLAHSRRGAQPGRAVRAARPLSVLRLRLRRRHQARQGLMRFLLHRVRLRSIALAACETAFIMAAVAIAAVVRLGTEDAVELFLNEGGVFKTLLVVAIAQISMYYADLYDLRIVADRRELFTRLIQALATTSFALAAIYFWFPATMLGRGVFLIASMLVMTLAVVWRVAFEWLSGRLGPRERLLLVGTGQAAVDLARELFSRRHELGVEIVGFIDPDPEQGRHGARSTPASSARSRTSRRSSGSRSVDRVVVSLADARGTLPVDRLLDMKLDGVSFDHLASVYEEYTGKIAVENLRPSWFIFSDGFRKTRFLSASKRAARHRVRHRAAAGRRCR